MPLEKLARVAPGTLVLTFDGDGQPRVRRPGELLVPSLLPFGQRLDALPVTTEVVALEVVISDLLTLDNQQVTRLVLRLNVQLSSQNSFAAVANLARDVGPSFGSFLMEQVQSAVERDVRAAFRMNRLAELRRQTVAEILGHRWLLTEFADGVLVRRGFSVAEVEWPAVAAPRPDRSTPAMAAVEPGPQARLLDLSSEARLQRLWRLTIGTGVWGVASAADPHRAVAVVVAETTPAGSDGAHLSEQFAQVLGVQTVRLVLVATEYATSYPTLVAEWLRLVDPEHRAGLQVESLGEEDRLRIWRDSAPGADAVDVTTSLEMEALRRLLPHRSVDVITRTRR